jgi:hypothetical protein
MVTSESWTIFILLILSEYLELFNFQVVTGLLPALIIEIRPQPEVTGKTRIYLDKRTNTWKTTKIPNVT